MDPKLLLLPVVSALIGWFTNVLAIRMMFRPRQPWKVPLLPLYIQGLLPKRRKEIAKTIGDTIERELFSIQSLFQRIDLQSYQNEIIDAVVNHARSRIESLLPGLLPPPIREKLVQVVAELAEKESRLVMDGIIDKVTDRIKGEVSIGELAEEKILELDLAELESIVLRVSSKELRHIEVLGGIIGFLIGVVQVGFLFLFD